MRAKFARGLCTSCVQSVGDYILWLLPKYMGKTQDVWRRVRESNPATRICNPLHNLPAHSPIWIPVYERLNRRKIPKLLFGPLLIVCAYVM